MKKIITIILMVLGVGFLFSLTSKFLTKKASNNSNNQSEQTNNGSNDNVDDDFDISLKHVSHSFRDGRYEIDLVNNKLFINGDDFEEYYDLDFDSNSGYYIAEIEESSNVCNHSFFYCKPTDSQFCYYVFRYDSDEIGACHLIESNEKVSSSYCGFTSFKAFNGTYKFDHLIDNTSDLSISQINDFFLDEEFLFCDYTLNLSDLVNNLDDNISILNPYHPTINGNTYVCSYVDFLSNVQNPSVETQRDLWLQFTLYGDNSKFFVVCFHLDSIFIEN